VGNSCTTRRYKQNPQNRNRGWQMMMIVGQVSTPEEAKEIEFIAKSLVIGNRVRVLALKLKEA